MLIHVRKRVPRGCQYIYKKIRPKFMINLNHAKSRSVLLTNSSEILHRVRHSPCQAVRWILLGFVGEEIVMDKRGFSFKEISGGLFILLGDPDLLHTHLPWTSHDISKMICPINVGVLNKRHCLRSFVLYHAYPCRIIIAWSAARCHEISRYYVTSRRTSSDDNSTLSVHKGDDGDDKKRMIV